MNSNIKKVFINFIYFFDFCINNYLVTDNNDIGSQFYVTVARGIFDSVLTPSDAAALYANAARAGKKALCICTISDRLEGGEVTTAEQRQNAFHDMMRVALSIAE